MAYVKKGYRRKVDWDDEPLLGKVPDKVLAAKYGVSQPAVVQARQSRGIVCFGRSTSPYATGPKHIDWDTQGLLGKIVDRELAEKLGVSQSAVDYARNSRGISPCGIVSRPNAVTIEVIYE